LFKRQADEFVQNIQQLAPIIAGHALGADLASDMLRSFILYRDGFYQVVKLQKQIGLNEDLGEQGAFRDAAHDLERELSHSDKPAMQIMLLQLRRHEKDFIMRRKMQYVHHETKQYQALHLALEQYFGTEQNRLVTLLNNYHSGFLRLVALSEKMGLEQNQGLQGMFLLQAQKVEAQLHNIDSRMTPIIHAEELKVKRLGMLIMLPTALAMLLLLFRSFVSFQQAFSEFIMFFYRCKRVNECIDERKMSFAEFKSLASAANEMVMSQRETEVQLKESLAKLAILQRQQTQNVAT
jgi:methyl-accepting chemotaxis protein